MSGCAARVVDVLLRAPTSSRVGLVGEVLRPAPPFLVVGQDRFPADLFIGDIEPSLWCAASGRRRPHLADVVRHDASRRAHVGIEEAVVALRHDDAGICIRRRPRHPDNPDRVVGVRLFGLGTPGRAIPGPCLRAVDGAASSVRTIRNGRLIGRTIIVASQCHVVVLW